MSKYVVTLEALQLDDKRLSRGNVVDLDDDLAEDLDGLMEKSEWDKLQEANRKAAEAKPSKGKPLTADQRAKKKAEIAAAAAKQDAELAKVAADVAAGKPASDGVGGLS